MVNSFGLIHKTNNKKGQRHDCDVYTKNHHVTSKDVAKVLISDTSELKDYPEQKLSLSNRKKRNHELIPTKKIQSKAY
jgi:hypothetical protein